MKAKIVPGTVYGPVKSLKLSGRPLDIITVCSPYRYTGVCGLGEGGGGGLRDRQTDTHTAHRETEQGDRERGWGVAERERERERERVRVSETEREGEKGCWGRKERHTNTDTILLI